MNHVLGTSFRILAEGSCDTGGPSGGPGSGNALRINELAGSPSKTIDWPLAEGQHSNPQKSILCNLADKLNGYTCIRRKQNLLVEVTSNKN